MSPAFPTSSEVDVLIIGAGPAGLMMALWMARLGVKARIVDKRSAKIFSGQADGFQVRTMEILDSFGIGERVWKEANHMLEVCFWNPDKDGRIRRDHRSPDVMPGLSRFCEVVLHQGRMETFFLDAIRASYPAATTAAAANGQQQQANGKQAVTNGGDGGATTPEDDVHRIEVERCKLPIAMSIDETAAEDDDAHPVKVTLRTLTEEEAEPAQVLSNLSDGMFRSNLAEDDVDGLMRRSEARGGKAGEEIVRCKYVVGADGAHSWTRKSLGKEFEMVGAMTDFIWGVLDIVPITDFPDIRSRAMIKSENDGSLMVIPRENKLVRLYIQLKEVSAGGGRIDRSKITPDLILNAARRIISPYKLDYHYVDWWTAYQIGQRVGEHFSKLNRVFLAGDAIHTHSPKAGQGMNVSMQDTYNLGWKLGLVCKKILQRRVLSTYEYERKHIAKQLISFDQKFATLFSGKPAKEIVDETGVSMEELTKAFRMSYMFTTAVGINYQPSLLVAKPPEGANAFEGLPEIEMPETADIVSPAQSTLSLATACKPGTRFPSFQVLGQADARPWQMHHAMPSDGRFRIVVFAGDISSDSALLERANGFGEWALRELLPRYATLALSVGASGGNAAAATKFRMERDPSVTQLLLVHCGPREDFEVVRDFHEAYHPFDPKLGWDYDAVFVDGPSYHDGHGEAYKNYGVDEKKGALVVVRPDGYIGIVTALAEEGWREIGRWFEEVLRPVSK